MPAGAWWYLYFSLPASDASGDLIPRITPLFELFVSPVILVITVVILRLSF